MTRTSNGSDLSLQSRRQLLRDKPVRRRLAPSGREQRLRGRLPRRRGRPAGSLAFRLPGLLAYQDANYGYTGYYVDQDDYNYYFREGFRRGYEDGFTSRYQYGSYSNGSYSMLDAILGQILGFQSLR